MRSQYETLLPTFGKGGKGPPDPLALVGKAGHDRADKGGKRKGRDRGEKGNGKEASREGDKAAKTKVVTCWRCRMTGHCSDSCTTKLCDRCGGRGMMATNVHRRRRPERRRRLCLSWLEEVLEAMTLKRRHSNRYCLAAVVKKSYSKRP